MLLCIQFWQASYQSPCRGTIELPDCQHVFLTPRAAGSNVCNDMQMLDQEGRCVSLWLVMFLRYASLMVIAYGDRRWEVRAGEKI